MSSDNLFSFYIQYIFILGCNFSPLFSRLANAPMAIISLFGLFREETLRDRVEGSMK